MCVAIAATGHHKTLVAVVYHLSLALFYEGPGSRLIAYIDILAVLHCKGFYNLIAIGGENLAIDYKVGTAILFATGLHTHADDCTHNSDEYVHRLHETHTKCFFHNASFG